MTTNFRPRVLIAKTGLDGHWRGVSVVSRALRDAGFEVILLGMARADQIVAVATQEGVDLVGLNIGGRIEVVERIVEGLRAASLDVPVFAGGTIPPPSAKRLEELGVRTFPPGSSLSSIVDAAYELTGTEPNDVEEQSP
jgi:methylmalonyl-CoA mutase C-terminal domain/subunit